jgi:hypothetical protein
MKKNLMFWILFFPLSAYAGMPTPFYMLTKQATFRLDSLSFFIVLILLVTWIIKLLWNYLRRDFSQLPYLNYKMAFVLVFILSLFFNILLLMIAGARELMTPQAWERQGITYKIVNGLYRPVKY